MMTASDSEAEEAEEPVAQRRRTSLATTPPPPAPLAVESVAAEAAAEDGGALRTVSGRTVRPPRNRLGESAAVTSPDLAAAEAAQVAEYEAVEAIRRQQQLPLLPGSLSLFKAAPTPPPAVASVAVPLVTVQQQGAALSASSDASAYSQPPSATAATAHLAASGGICSLQGVLAGTEAGGKRVLRVEGQRFYVWIVVCKCAASAYGQFQAMACAEASLVCPATLPSCRLYAAACDAAALCCASCGTNLASARHGAAAMGRRPAAIVWRANNAARRASVASPPSCGRLIATFSGRLAPTHCPCSAPGLLACTLLPIRTGELHCTAAFLCTLKRNHTPHTHPLSFGQCIGTTHRHPMSVSPVPQQFGEILAPLPPPSPFLPFTAALCTQPWPLYINS